jgi:hypothetical protein
MNGNTEPLIQKVEIEHAQSVFEDLIKPWQDMSKRFLTEVPESFENSAVLMPVRGHWKLSWEGGNVVLNPGDTCLLEPGFSHRIEPSVTGEASLYRILSNEDPAGPTWVDN